MAKKSYRDALREALLEEMREQPDLICIGEDLIPQGGSFGVHEGLNELYPGRIWQTPISESAIAGLAVGYALTGKPVAAEIMFSDFLTCCMDEIVNQAAKLRYMSGGQTPRLPFVLRSPVGLGKNVGAQHSQTMEAWFAHTPGLVVCLPASPADAKGMLKSALRGADPVIFLENKMLYATEGEVPDGVHVAPLGEAAVVREGGDVTVVAIGRMVHLAAKAAETLAEDGIEVEIVDPRTVAPIDWDTIFTSVEKTGRVVVVEEATGHCSIGAEIAASIAEFRFLSLDFPVRRLSAPHAPKPFTPPLEALSTPSEEQIVAMVRETSGRSPV